MARVELRLPQMGMGMSDAEILEWHVAVGDHVAEGDVIITAETAKATVEVPAPATGTLVEAAVAVGDVPLTGDLLAVIEVD